MKTRSWLLAGLLSAAVSLSATEYFVSPAGSDGNEGTASAPFKTIQKGVNKLKPGDVLTIHPGRYHESVTWKFSGSPEKRTVVRAKIPGTVLLHGDQPAGQFRKVPDRQSCWETDWPQRPQAVLEGDTQVTYTPAGKLEAGSPVVSFAVWHYDEAKKLLRISTGDGLAPKSHRILISDSPRHGFSVEPENPNGKVVNVEVDGLCCRGFNTNTPQAHQSVWGIFLDRPENCTVRRCHAYLNAGGIGMRGADRCRIEECTALSNGAENHVSAGNVIMLDSKNSVIDRCFSLKSRTYGIRFYGGGNVNDRISRSVSLGDIRGAIWIKPCDALSLLSEVYTDGRAACKRSEYSVFSGNEYDADGKNGTTSQAMQKVSVTTCGRDFADPWNGDLRLQAGSTIKRGFKGENVYFIAPDGSDDRDGRSIETPWKTLKKVPSDSTVYFLPGIYAGGLELTANNVTLAGRGQTAPAVINGGKNGLTVTGSGITVRRLNLLKGQESGLLCRGKNIVIDRCGFERCIAVKADGARDLRVTHCAFGRGVVAPVAAKNSTGMVLHSILPHGELPEGFALAGNAYVSAVPAADPAGIRLEAEFNGPERGDFSLKNEAAFRGRALDGFSLGPYFIQHAPETISLTPPKPLQAGRGAAVIGWWTSMKAKASFRIRAKEPNANWQFYPDYTSDNELHTIMVPGLKAGTAYEYQLILQPAMEFRITSRYLPEPPKEKNPKKKKPKRLSIPMPVMNFTMPATDRPAQSWHVSAENGSDLNDGSEARPFRTVFRAAMATLPGDEVIVHRGVYEESVTVPCGGLPDQPVVYRNARRETVWLDGSRRRCCRGFVMFGKENLKFDGFHFRMYGTKYPNSSAAVMIHNGKNIEVSRCFHDGRGGGYAPPILNCRMGDNIALRNSVAINGMTQVTLVGVGNTVIENNVLVMPAIWTVAAFLAPDNSIRFRRNIVTDNSRAKTLQGLLRLDNLRALTEQDNIYYVRFPRNLRVIVDYQNDGKVRKSSWSMLKLDDYYRHVGSDGGSVFVNPNFRVFKLWQWKDAAERKRDQDKGVELGKKINDQEFQRNPADMSQYRPLDFADCFVPKAHPVGKDGKIIGLEPGQFIDLPGDAGPKHWEQR